MENIFCNFSQGDEKLIEGIFNIIYDVESFQEIKHIYTKFKEKFDSEAPSNELFVARENLIPKTSDTVFKTKFEEPAYQIGIDMPVMIGSKQNVKGTIFVVAQDALRNFNQCSHEIRIGTPFAVHLKAYRNHKMRVYWSVIQELVNRKYNVYVTDIYKFWMGTPSKLKIKLPGDLHAKFSTAFKLEIAGFKPQAVITFGNVAHKFASSFCEPESLIAFPHPAPTANGKWKILLSNEENEGNVRCSEDNKITHMIAKINNRLPY